MHFSFSDILLRPFLTCPGKKESPQHSTDTSTGAPDTSYVKDNWLDHSYILIIIFNNIADICSSKVNVKTIFLEKTLLLTPD